jgi:mono/diheme cytochrome c family protein
MRKARVAILVVCLVFSLIFLVQEIATDKAQTATQSKRIRKGSQQKAKELFSKHCARCHGEDGKAETQEGLNLGATDLTSERLKKMSQAKIASTIKEGKGAMPSFSKELSRSEISLLANYVKKFSN